MGHDNEHPYLLCRARSEAVRRHYPAREGRFLGRLVATTALFLALTPDSSQITYDLAGQVPESELPGLRDRLLLLLKHFAAGPKPIRVQLCVCLAILAIQMKAWRDVLGTVVTSLGDDVESHACILDFLRVLPEEVTEGRKIHLSVRGPRKPSSTGPSCLLPLPRRRSARSTSTRIRV